MTTMTGTDELKACRACGSPCRIEEFGGGDHVRPFVGLLCSKAKLFGGDCPDETLYFDADAWNTRPAPLPDDVALARFTEYFVRNYPGPDTIIHKPHWHAPRIFRAAIAAMRSDPPLPDGLER